MSDFIKMDAQYMKDHPDEVVKALTSSFTPNWQRLGLASYEEAVRYVLAFLKKYEKSIAERGYGETVIKDGTLQHLLILKGDTIKRRKEFIQL